MVKKIKTILGAFVVACLIFALNGIGMAAPWGDPGGPGNPPPPEQEPPSMVKQAKKALPKLVKNDTITKEQEDKIIAFLK